MGQYWKLINVDTFEGDSRGKMGEFFWNERRKVIDLLSVPVEPSEWPQLKIGEMTPSASQTTDLLLKLPNEVLMKIAREIKTYAELLSFAFVCVRLWQVSEAARYQFLRDLLRQNSWAGHRIILLGDYAHSLPKNLFSKEEEERLKGTDDRDINGKFVYRRAAADSLVTMTKKNLIPSPLRSFYQRQCYYSIPEAEAWVDFVPDDFTLQRTPSTVPEDRWMLRNLTKREFVLKKSAGPVGLLHVLHSLIGWSDDPSTSMSYGSSLIRGRWAGDRIDATLSSLHDSEAEAEAKAKAKAQGGEASPDWKDITDAVVKRLTMIAESEGMTMRWSGEDF